MRLSFQKVMERAERGGATKVADQNRKALIITHLLLTVGRSFRL